MMYIQLLAKVANRNLKMTPPTDYVPQRYNSVLLHLWALHCSQIYHYFIILSLTFLLLSLVCPRVSLCVVVPQVLSDEAERELLGGGSCHGPPP